MERKIIYINNEYEIVDSIEDIFNIIESNFNKDLAYILRDTIIEQKQDTECIEDLLAEIESYQDQIDDLEYEVEDLTKQLNNKNKLLENISNSIASDLENN